MSYLLLFVTWWLTLVELNCENLFDYEHDALKDDTEWTPTGKRRWSVPRYRLKLRHVAQQILSSTADTTDWRLPDLIALTEVENDRVMLDLTRHSLLRNAGYEYLMTESNDSRGIDVALLYQPFSFRPICYDCISVEPLPRMRPTRDILYVRGLTVSYDTLHVFVVHAPSKLGGAKNTLPWRQHVIRRLLSEVESIRKTSSTAHIIMMGDFNDVAKTPLLQQIEASHFVNATKEAKGKHGAKATYCYRGFWQSIDHIFISTSLMPHLEKAIINDSPFLLEKDKKYGGVKPFRTYNGYRHQGGFSDHLPLVVRLRFSE